MSTFPSPSSTFPNLQTGSSRPESFPPPPDAIGGVEAQFHRRSASPVALRSNRPWEWIRGEFLVLSGLFPLPWCVAGTGERPPPSPPHLLPPVARVKSYASRTVRLGGADSLPVRLDFVQRRCCLWWFSRTELRTVRYRRADGPPLKLEICPETLLSLVDWIR